jgi:AraC-like DNA-binding protein
METSLYVSIVFVRGLVAELARRGFDNDAILADTDIDSVQLADGRAIVPAAAWHALIHRGVKLTGDSGLGLAMGEHLPENTMQLISQLALACGTLREAMGMLQRYAQLLGNMSTFELVEEGDLAYFVFEPFLALQDLPQFPAELALGLVYRTARKFRGRPMDDALEVWFTHAAPDYAARYANVFACTVRFGRPRNAILFSRHLLDERQPLADVLMVQLLQNAAEKMLRELGHPSLPDRVRALLRYESDLCHVDARRIAKALKLHPRALRRQLADANAPLSGLLDEVRCRIACEELMLPGASIKAISDRLGFSEPSAFHRAFKRWTGRTPTEYGRGLLLQNDDEEPQVLDSTA